VSASAGLVSAAITNLAINTAVAINAITLLQTTKYQRIFKKSGKKRDAKLIAF
jgi:hypothetical protein